MKIMQAQDLSPVMTDYGRGHECRVRGDCGVARTTGAGFHWSWSFDKIIHPCSLRPQWILLMMSGQQGAA